MREKGIYGESANEEGSDYDYDEDEFDDPAEFTSEQLKWIQTHYISNGAFMFSHGLNLNCYFDHVDAKEIVNVYLRKEKESHVVDR